MLPLVLLVDSQLSRVPRWQAFLTRSGCDWIEAGDLAAAGKCIASTRSRVVLLYFCETQAALQAALRIRQLDRNLPVIVVVEGGSEEFAVAAFRAGVTDYFHALQEEAALLLELRKRCAHCESGDAFSPDPAGSLIGCESTICTLRRQLERIANCSSNVLITGETGTGKELVAAAIHKVSPRNAKPMVRVNCAAIPDALAESELFGYERGAFTGAYLRNPGWLEAAHQGTMFLDEIGDLSPVTQAKLLRVIENKEFRRLGGKAEIRVDVRFIAATNRNLEVMAAEGRFREDLYFRLNIARVHLLPLRERRDDIPVLLRHYLDELSARDEKSVTRISDEVWNCALTYDWPGNVRELKNVLESAFVNSAGGEISMGDLPWEFRQRCARGVGAHPDERQVLLSALLQTKWNKSRAAEQLSWSRMTLYRKMRKYRISSCSDH